VPATLTELLVFLWTAPCRDPNLVKRIGAATALEVRATGIQYAFAPCIAVSILNL
jgi:beta-glucosidase-like glycosyl hydrolase